ncbi:MAG: hypothetical protein V4557_01660 [Bacteroidota bacterium]
MKPIVYFSVLLGIYLVFLSCSEKRVSLGIVRNIPVYFQNNLLFGERIKSMQEKNAFILATGQIDTTDEHPPTEVAFVSFDSKLIQLNLMEKTTTSEKVSKTYIGAGLTLLLTYTIHYDGNFRASLQNAHIAVSYKNLHSDYAVFIKKGYF